MPYRAHPDSKNAEIADHTFHVVSLLLVSGVKSERAVRGPFHGSRHVERTAGADMAQVLDSFSVLVQRVELVEAEQLETESPFCIHGEKTVGIH